MTQCPKLTVLACSSNPLTTLDVTQCPKLVLLYCESNQLTTLDVTQCPELTELDCCSNQLTTLDVTQCSKLTQLDCSSNQLTALDVTQCMQLYWLYCYENKIVGNAMTKLVNSLPDRTSQEEVGDFVVVSDRPQESNLCLKSDVAIAKAKNWNTLRWNTTNEQTESYEGEERGSAIDALSIQTVRLYPNPASEVASLNGLTPHSEILLYTLEGVRLGSLCADAEGRATLDVSILDAGVYLVKTMRGDFRLIVAH